MPRKDKAAKGKKAKAAEEEPATPAEPSSWTCAECLYEHEGDEAAEAECLACGAAPPQAEGDDADGDGEGDQFAGYKVGVVTELEELSGKLKALAVDVGGGEQLPVVTNAPNVVEGSRVVIATVGARFMGKGEEMVVKKASKGGKPSQGVVCSSTMLGWSGGGVATAALLPESFAPGDKPPEKRPRMDQ